MIVRDIEELVARDDMLWMMVGWETCVCDCEWGAGERGKREIEIEIEEGEVSEWLRARLDRNRDRQTKYADGTQNTEHR